MGVEVETINTGMHCGTRCCREIVADICWRLQYSDRWTWRAAADSQPSPPACDLRPEIHQYGRGHVHPAPIPQHPGNRYTKLLTLRVSDPAVIRMQLLLKAGMVRVWVAGKTVWSPCYTRAISERLRDKELIYKALYKSDFFTLL